MRTKMYLSLGAVILSIGLGTAWAASLNVPEVPASCCSSKVASTQAGLLYCPLADVVLSECCCKVIDGKWVCQITGTVSDTCCCIPLAEGK